jgi:hypothetical protein
MLPQPITAHLHNSQTKPTLLSTDVVHLAWPPTEPLPGSCSKGTERVTQMIWCCIEDDSRSFASAPSVHCSRRFMHDIRYACAGHPHRVPSLRSLALATVDQMRPPEATHSRAVAFRVFHAPGSCVLPIARCTLARSVETTWHLPEMLRRG